MRSIWLRSAFLSLIALVSWSGAASGQIFTPGFMPPRMGSTMGLFLSDAGSGDLAVEAVLRRSFGAFDLGVRGGIIDVGETQITLGAEYRNPIYLAVPIDVAVTAAAQGILGDVDWLGLSAGATVGTTIVPGAFAVTPFVHPRIGLVDGPGDDGFDIELLAEVGADFALANGIAVTFSIGLDEVSPDWGFGLSWR